MECRNTRKNGGTEVAEAMGLQALVCPFCYGWIMVDFEGVIKMLMTMKFLVIISLMVMLLMRILMTMLATTTMSTMVMMVMAMAPW